MDGVEKKSECSQVRPFEKERLAAYFAYKQSKTQ